MEKEKKHFNLDQDIVNIIRRVKEEQGFGSEVKALSYIVRKYDDFSGGSVSDAEAEKIADVFLSKFNETYYKYLERLRWATQTAEINSIITKDVLNTILVTEEIQNCVLTDIACSPVISVSEDYQKKKIEHFRQKKIDRKNRKSRGNG